MIPKWLKSERHCERDEVRSQLGDVKKKIQQLTEIIEQKADAISAARKRDVDANQ